MAAPEDGTKYINRRLIRTLFLNLTHSQNTEGQAPDSPKEGAGGACGLHAGTLFWGAES